MKILVINLIMAGVILAITFGSIYWSDNVYGKKGVIFEIAYLIAGIYVILKVIPWKKEKS